jgi:hypothetical protein
MVIWQTRVLGPHKPGRERAQTLKPLLLRLRSPRLNMRHDRASKLSHLLGSHLTGTPKPFACEMFDSWGGNWRRWSWRRLLTHLNLPNQNLPYPSRNLSGSLCVAPSWPTPKSASARRPVNVAPTPCRRRSCRSRAPFGLDPRGACYGAAKRKERKSRSYALCVRNCVTLNAGWRDERFQSRLSLRHPRGQQIVRTLRHGFRAYRDRPVASQR